jgi:TIR domain
MNATSSDNPQTATQVAEIDLYGPAGVFISYASEDHDIAKAIYQSLQALGETIFDRVKIFFDSKAVDGGDEIRDDIKKGLKNSDFGCVVYRNIQEEPRIYWLRGRIF